MIYSQDGLGLFQSSDDILAAHGLNISHGTYFFQLGRFSHCNRGSACAFRSGCIGNALPLPQRPRQTLQAALGQGPASFLELMAAVGTRDGREIVRDFGKLYEQGRLRRLKDGRYTLNGGG